MTDKELDLLKSLLSWILDTELYLYGSKYVKAGDSSWDDDNDLFNNSLHCILADYDLEDDTIKSTFNKATDNITILVCELLLKITLQERIDMMCELDSYYKKEYIEEKEDDR